MEFKLEDGAYRIKESQAKELKEFLLKKLEKAGKKTKSGGWSKGSKFPAVYVDGVKKIFKNHGSAKNPNVWALDDVGLKQDYASDRISKLKQTDELSKSKIAQMKVDIDEMNMFQGLEPNDPDEYFIEHDSRVTDHAEIEGQAVKHGADDWHNQHPSKRKTGKVKTHLEGMANSWNSPWRVRTDPATGQSRIINLSEYDPNNYVGKGIVIDSTEEAEAISKSLKQGKAIKGVDKNKLKYLMSERVSTSGSLDDALSQWKVYGKTTDISGAKMLINKANNLKGVKTIKNVVSNPLVKKAGFIAPVAGLTIASGIVATDVQAATREPSAKNYAKLGLSTFDAGLEVVDTFTAGLSTPVTMALQLATGIARHQIEHGTRSSSKMDMTSRRRYRTGQG